VPLLACLVCARRCAGTVLFCTELQSFSVLATRIPIKDGANCKVAALELIIWETISVSRRARLAGIWSDRARNVVEKDGPSHTRSTVGTGLARRTHSAGRSREIDLPYEAPGGG
jgi:hypothetical protein